MLVKIFLFQTFKTTSAWKTFITNPAKILKKKISFSKKKENEKITYWKIQATIALETWFKQDLSAIRER